MTELKNQVRELFEQDRQINSLEKDIKVKNAHYHHLILKNGDRVYSDEEVLAIHKAYEDLKALEGQRSVFHQRIQEIKNYLKSLLAPLSGGRWVHQTEDPIHPCWEFWVEEDELKYARMNGANY